MSLPIAKLFCPDSADCHQLASVPVTTLYEDLEAALRARALIEVSQSGMDLPVPLQVELWRFDWLRERSLNTMAMNRAKNSTLLILSTSSANPPPSHIEKWIKHWTQCPQGQPLALVILLARKPDWAGQQDGLHNLLREAARQKGAEFWCEWFEAGPTRRELPTGYPLTRKPVFKEGPAETKNGKLAAARSMRRTPRPQALQNQLFFQGNPGPHSPGANPEPEDALLLTPGTPAI